MRETMSFLDYFRLLSTTSDSSAYIEMDRRRELQYLGGAIDRFEAITAAIPAQAPRCEGPARLLDVGTTPFTLYLKQAFAQYDMWTLDRTPLMEERCNKHGVRFVVGDLDTGCLPFPEGYFDVVVFTEVLEHVFAPASDVLGEIRRILSPGGVAIIGVPNIARLSNRVRLLMGKSPLDPADVQLNKDWVHGHGHLHEYTRNEISSHCASTGFQVAGVRMISASPLSVWRNHSDKIAMRLMIAIAASCIPPLRQHILVVCHK